jgi:hypothetical protein
MDLGYFHEKLSNAVNEICTSDESLKVRLRSSLRYGFTAFPAETLPDGLRDQFSEIKAALGGGRIRSRMEDYPDPIDCMKHSQVLKLLDETIVPHKGVTEEYNRRAFQSR